MGAVVKSVWTLVVVFAVLAGLVACGTDRGTEIGLLPPGAASEPASLVAGDAPAIVDPKPTAASNQAEPESGGWSRPETIRGSKGASALEIGVDAAGIPLVRP